MLSSRPSIAEIKRAIQQVCLVLEEKNTLSRSWTVSSEDHLWRELVSCILGSRVRYETALDAVERMNDAGLFAAHYRSLGEDEYRNGVAKALSETGQSASSCCAGHRYPFAELRAKQISKAAQRLYSDYGSIRSVLRETENCQSARRFLASEVPGLGPKQSSLFLRNIGYSEDVAVLDVHVLTYMYWMELTSDLVKSISTLRRYEALEHMLMEHSLANGYRAGHFDIAVWVVVRTAKKECEVWH